MVFLPFTIFLIILVFLVLEMFIPTYKNHQKATAGTINYDLTMRKFVYKVNLSGDDIIHKLTTKNIGDNLVCSVSIDRSVLLFSEKGSEREYYFHIQERSGFSIFRLEQTALVGMQSHIPYKLNPFMVHKLQAELIPYSQYKK